VEGGGRRTLLGSVGVINENPLPASSPSRRSGRFSSTRVGASTLHVEDITGFDPPPLLDENNIGGSEIHSNPDEILEPALNNQE
jgi:hypothetical protein